jgi:hypothetical protein
MKCMDQFDWGIQAAPRWLSTIEASLVLPLGADTEASQLTDALADYLASAGQLRKHVSHMGCLYLTSTSAVVRASRSELAQPQITVEIRGLAKPPNAPSDYAPPLLVRMGHDIGNAYYEHMAEIRGYGGGMGGNKQADIIEVGLGLWWVQEKANLPAEVPRLKWKEVHRLLAEEALALVDQGPAPSLLPVSFQAFLTDLEALETRAESTSGLPRLLSALRAAQSFRFRAEGVRLRTFWNKGVSR